MAWQNFKSKAFIILRSRMWRSLTILLFTCLFCLPALSGAAPAEAGFHQAAVLNTADNIPDFKVQALFDGRYRDNSWAVLEITLKNGPQPWRGEVRATLPYGPDSNYTFSQPVELAAGVESRFLLYVLPTRYEPRFDVILNNAAGERVDLEPVRLQVSGTADYTIGILADADKLGTNTLPRPGVIKTRQTDVRTVFIPITPANLPDRSDALDTFDSIIIGNLDPAQLTAAQWRMLLGWVEEGGRLWLSGSPAFAKLSSSLDASLMAASSQGTVEINRLSARGLPDTVLPALSARGAPSLTLQRLKPEAGAQVAMQQEGGNADGLPLVVSRALGRGVVLTTAFDLASPTLTAVGEINRYWAALADISNTGPDATFLRQDLFEMPHLPRQIASQPPLELPNPLWILLGLGVYALIAVPSCYLIYSKLDKPLLVLVAGPVLALVCGGVVAGVGMNMAAAEIHLNRVGLASFYADGAPAAVKSFGVSIGAGGQEYILEMAQRPAEARSLYRPQNLTLPNQQASTLPPQLFVQGATQFPAQIVSDASRNGQYQSFSAEGTLEAKLTLESKLAILPDGSGLAGTITNNSNWALSNVVLVLGNNYLELGDLPIGEVRKVSFPFKGQSNILARQSVDVGLYGANVSNSNSPSSNDTQEIWERNLRWITLNTAYLNGRFSTQYQSYSLYLTGWLEGPAASEILGSVKASDNLTMRQQDFALMIKPLPLSYQPEGSEQRVFIPASVLSSARLSVVDANTVADGSMRLSPNGSVVLQYRLPTQLSLRPNRLSLFVTARQTNRNGPQLGPQLEIYNWERQSWEVIAGFGDSRSRIDLTGPTVAAYIEPVGGFIKLKATSKTEVYILQQLNLELEGLKQ